MNILAIDTSSMSGSVAVGSYEKLIYLSYLDLKSTHSERLMPQIDSSLKASGLSIKDIDCIAVVTGTGSFTGLRIGLATAKGLCVARKIPFVAVRSLDVLAFQVVGVEKNIISCIDARMGEIYAAVYDKKMNYIIEPDNYKPETFIEMCRELDDTFYAVGSGLAMLKDELKLVEGAMHQNIIMASSLISYMKHKGLQPEYNPDFIAAIEPEYMRKSQAELNLKKK